MSPTSPDVLYVITDLDVGGVPLHLHRLARTMRDRGLVASVVCLAKEGPVAEMLRNDGIDVFSCRGVGGWDWRVLGRLAKLIRRLEPAVVHAVLFHANIAARWAARRIGFPVDRLLCEIQTVEVERRWHLRIDRWTHRLCRLTIGNSPSVIEHLVVHARIPRERLHLIRGGIDPNRIRSVGPIHPDDIGVPSDAPIVLWAGRLDPVKGLDDLIAAFERLADDTPAHLLLAGDGPMRDRLARRIARSSVAARMHLLGSRSDVPALLNTADLFVFPSRTEGLPNALLEALAAGCPIVTTDAPGCRDLIEHGRTGLLVPHGDTTALTQAMRTMLHDRAAESFGQRTIQEVSEKWHIDKTHDAYADLYDAIRGIHSS